MIQQDYEEAQLIRDISPRASAALARRCLQGMIRDRYEINMETLNKEIRALKGKVDDQCWNAINALRRIGNIGAHPEKGGNVAIDISTDQAVVPLRLSRD